MKSIRLCIRYKAHLLLHTQVNNRFQKVQEIEKQIIKKIEYMEKLIHQTQEPLIHCGVCILRFFCPQKIFMIHDS